jgi:hypothetical protein
VLFDGVLSGLNDLESDRLRQKINADETSSFKKAAASELKSDSVNFNNYKALE